MIGTEQTTNYEAMVREFLTDAYGDAFSEDDGMWLAHNGFPIRVTVRGTLDRPVAVLTSRVAIRVKDRARAAVEVALLNRSGGAARWVLVGDDVYLASQTPLWPAVSGHLTALVRQYVVLLVEDEANLLLRTGAKPAPRERTGWRNLLAAPYVPIEPDPAGLREKVSAWLEHRFGEPQPVDDDFDFEIEAPDGQPVWIRVLDDSPGVAMFARVVTGPRGLREPLIEAALVTDLAQASKWYVTAGAIWQRVEVPVEFFFAEHLDQVLDEFLVSFAQVQDDLALRTNGRVEF